MTSSGRKEWMTIMPGFVYMESLLRVKYEVKDFINLRKEVSKLEKEDFKKNSRINKLREENSDLQKV